MKTKLVFFGSPEFSVGFLADLNERYEVVLVVTGPDAVAGHRRNRTTAVKQYAVSHGLEVISPQRLDEPTIATIARANAQIGVVVAYGKILPSSLIAKFDKGLINVHGSILPKYRGASPIEAAIFNGDQLTGPTIMLVEPELDSGPILAQQSFALTGLDQPAAYAKMAAIGRPLLLKTLNSYLAGRIKPTPQDDNQASFTTRIVKSDGRLDFSMSAEQLTRQILAYASWPGSFFDYRGSVINVISARPSKGSLPTKQGQLFSRSGRLFVSCADGALELLRLKPAGKKEISGRDFINSHRELLRF